MTGKALILCSCLATGLIPASIHASSCCGIGSSSVAAGHPAVHQGMFLVMAGADFGKSQSHDFVREGMSLGLAYGVTDRLALSLRSSYARLQTSLFRMGRFDTIGTVIDTIKPDTTFRFNNHGFGDGTVGAQFAIVPLNALTMQELRTGLDLGIPWGKSDKMTTIEGLEVEMPPKSQTGSGVVSLGGFVAYNRTFPAQKIAGAATLGGRTRFKRKNGDKPGNEANLIVTAIAGPFWLVKGQASIGYTSTGRTLYPSGIRDSTTGGNRVDLTPAVELSITEHAKLTLDAELPLWRDANQKLNGNNFSMRLSSLIFIPAFRRE